MKKISQSLLSLVGLIVVIFLGLVASAAAQEVVATQPTVTPVPVVQTDPAVDPLMVARAFALKTPDHYQVQLSGTVLVSNSWSSFIFQAVMDSEGNITGLRINDVAIKLPKPIHSLPIGDGGVVKDVEVFVAGFSVTGEYVGYGRLYKGLVFGGDNLTVEFRPAVIRVVVPGVDVVGYGNDIRIKIPALEEYGYGWGSDAEGNFFVDLPVVGGTYDYELTQWSTGRVIGTGKINGPFKPVETSKDAFIGLTLQGNVRQVKLTDDPNRWVRLNSRFDCQVPVGGNSVSMGKVFFMDVGDGGLDFVADVAVAVNVYRVTDSGDLTEVPVSNLTYQPNPYQTHIATPSKTGKVVMAVTPLGKVGDYVPNFFFRRYYGPMPPPDTAGDGGGKG